MNQIQQDYEAAKAALQAQITEAQQRFAERSAAIQALLDQYHAQEA